VGAGLRSRGVTLLVVLAIVVIGSLTAFVAGKLADGSDHFACHGPTDPPRLSNGNIAFVQAASLAGPRIVGAQIYTVSPDGSSPRRLIESTASSLSVTDPAWSPDGRSLAFIRGTPTSLGSFGGDGNLVVSKSDGSSQHTLTDQVADSAPAWSPDGHSIVFTRNQGSSLYTINALGGPSTQLGITSLRGFRGPSWSPDGAVIAIARRPTPGQDILNIYLLQLNGLTMSNQTDSETFSSSDPAWSPDGCELAYGSSGAGHTGIFVLTANGHVTQLTDCRPPGCTLDEQPEWSPDGTSIVFIRVISGKGHLSVVSALGGNVMTVPISSSKDICCPAWQSLLGGR
jgi:TolB protein